MITYLQSTDLYSSAVLGDDEDLPVIIPIKRLMVRVMKMVHMWNTAKRIALQNKSKVTGSKSHLLLALPVM